VWVCNVCLGKVYFPVKGSFHHPKRLKAVADFIFHRKCLSYDYGGQSVKFDRRQQEGLPAAAGGGWIVKVLAF